MAALSFILPTTSLATRLSTRTRRHHSTSFPRISCVQWDPEGIFKRPPQTGHLAKLEFKRRLEKDAEAREAYERGLREEIERRKTIRDARVPPNTVGEMVEYFLDTEAQEFEIEVARMRPRLNEEFFSHLKFEIGQLRFAVTKTQDMEDRLIELEALQKALEEATEAYDKMQSELIKAKSSLTKIFTSKDIKATLLEMVEQNEINKSLLSLLDENIATAHQSNQKQVVDYMEKVRVAVLKYITV
ncbi:hypothetical protein Drorol1_Dr00000344 [Drosera rotundifolia]